MKLLKKNVRVNTNDSLGHGLDAVIIIALFFLGGFGLDRLFDTTPVFMIVMTLLGAVGLFATFKYRYEARMEELEAQRRGEAPHTAARRTATAAANDEGAAR